MTIHPLLIGLLMAAAGTTAAALLPAPGELPVLAALFIAVGLGTAALVSRGTGTKALEDSDDDHAEAGQDDASDRESGEVKWFNANKGFGFIIRESGEEIFVHFRSIRGSDRRGLRDGQSVTFRVAETAKGPQAEDVKPL